jgi:hypothetical protein
MTSRHKHHDHSSTLAKGTELEERVAAAYLLLGADPVQRNLRLAGHQVDVYVEVRGADGFSTRIGLECKNYARPLGVNELSGAAQKLSHLRHSGHIDLSIIVSANGFTPEALTAAKALGVRTTTLADLLRRVEDFSDYLNRALRDYEATRLHILDLYRSLRCRDESGQDLGYIDKYVPDFFSTGGRFITLLGDYGTGKTTFAQRYFWEASIAYLTDPLSSRIPVFVPLKRYRKEVNIRSLLMDLLLHEYGIRIRDYSAFLDMNRRGRLLIILDAFDEMATGAEEAEILSNFRELRSLVVDRACVLLTCRTHYFKDEDQIRKVHTGTSLYRELEGGEQPYKLCFLDPFARDDVVTLVHKYEPNRASEYLSVIDSTYNLQELSRHPILLDMILTTVPEVLKGSTLVTPADLYHTYTGFWLDRDDWRTRMSHEQREFFMKELALYFQFTGITEIGFRDLPRYIRQKFPGLRTFRDLDYFEADVRTCTFLVRDRRGYYTFAHRSFAEYFAARSILDHLLAGRWPTYLGQGKGREGSTEWITPETARFLVEIVEKRQCFNSLVELFLRPKLDGTLLLVVLSVFKWSPRPDHRQLFDIAYVLLQKKQLAGVDFRGHIAELAEAFHTANWRLVRSAMETHSTGELLYMAFAELRSSVQGAGEAPPQPDEGT